MLNQEIRELQRKQYGRGYLHNENISSHTMQNLLGFVKMWGVWLHNAKMSDMADMSSATNAVLVRKARNIGYARRADFR